MPSFFTLKKSKKMLDSCGKCLFWKQAALVYYIVLVPHHNLSKSESPEQKKSKHHE